MKKYILVLLSLALSFTLIKIAFCQNSAPANQADTKVDRKAILLKQKEKKVAPSNKQLTGEDLSHDVMDIDIKSAISDLEQGFNNKTLGTSDNAQLMSDLAEMGATAAVPTFTKILLEYDLKDTRMPDKDPSWYERESAAEALGRIADSTVIPDLWKAYTSDTNDEVRSTVGEAIFRIKLSSLTSQNGTKNDYLASKQLLTDKDDIIKFNAAEFIIDNCASKIYDPENNLLVDFVITAADAKTEIQNEVATLQKLEASSKDAFVVSQTKEYLALVNERGYLDLAKGKK